MIYLASFYSRQAVLSQKSIATLLRALHWMPNSVSSVSMTTVSEGKFRLVQCACCTCADANASIPHYDFSQTRYSGWTMCLATLRLWPSTNHACEEMLCRNNLLILVSPCHSTWAESFLVGLLGRLVEANGQTSKTLQVLGIAHSSFVSSSLLTQLLRS